VPAAGLGTRLQTPGPKELLPIGPGRTLIDLVFELIPRGAGVHVVVVLSPEKMSIADYLCKYAGEFPLAFVLQSERRGSCIDGVIAARPWFGTMTVVLLPDQLIVPSAMLPDPVRATFEALSEEDVCFIAKLEGDQQRFPVDGALELAAGQSGDQRVHAYAEKPTTDLDRFNAIWAGFGFRDTVADELLDRMLEAELSNGGDLCETGLPIGARALIVDDCVDLGTWEAICGCFCGAVA
jgi:UTP-glucose-1-phosphate uridylyltransferase